MEPQYCYLHLGCGYTFVAAMHDPNWYQFLSHQQPVTSLRLHHIHITAHGPILISFRPVFPLACATLICGKQTIRECFGLRAHRKLATLATPIRPMVNLPVRRYMAYRTRLRRCQEITRTTIQLAILLIRVVRRRRDGLLALIQVGSLKAPLSWERL